MVIAEIERTAYNIYLMLCPADWRTVVSEPAPVTRFKGTVYTLNGGLSRSRFRPNGDTTRARASGGHNSHDFTSLTCENVSFKRFLVKDLTS